MSSQRYSEARTFHTDNLRGTDTYDIPYNREVNVPIQHPTSSFNNNNNNERRLPEHIRLQDTKVQWVNDPISGKEKFRVTVHIDGFSQNEVNIRVDGNKLLVNGEHIENQNQSSAKKVIEKSFELPRDIDSLSPHVTFPTPVIMQVDFPSRYSNVIIDDGRLSSKITSNYDTNYRRSPQLTQERSSSEYTSTRKLGGGGGGGGGGGDRLNYERYSSPRTYSPYDELNIGNNVGRSSAYSSTNRYESSGHEIPVRQGFISSTTDSFNNSNSPTYTYRVTTSDSQPKITNPLSSRSETGNVYEKTFSETRRETHHSRSSPTTGVQSSHEVEHNRSGSPSITKSFDEDRFRSSNLSLGHHRSLTPPSSSRNVEVREFSRRIGSNANNNNNNNEPSLFTQGFNSDAFYRSAFQPEIFTDNHGQKRVEMKLDVSNYDPSEIKVSVNGNDLVVQAEHNVNRPPTSSSRAYFYKQVTLPANTDIGSLSSQYHTDGKLHITAKLNHEQPSIRYN